MNQRGERAVLSGIKSQDRAPSTYVLSRNCLINSNSCPESKHVSGVNATQCGHPFIINDTPELACDQIPDIAVTPTSANVPRTLHNKQWNKLIRDEYVRRYAGSYAIKSSETRVKPVLSRKFRQNSFILITDGYTIPLSIITQTRSDHRIDRSTTYDVPKIA